LGIPDHPWSADQLVRDADVALYRAKARTAPEAVPALRGVAFYQCEASALVVGGGGGGRRSPPAGGVAAPAAPSRHACASFVTPLSPPER
jgi:hypothetical protein